MLSAQERQNKITSLLAKIHQENASLQQSCIELVPEICKISTIILYIENMYEIRRQLRELVGDVAAIAMIAGVLEAHSESSEIEQADLGE